MNINITKIIILLTLSTLIMTACSSRKIHIKQNIDQKATTPPIKLSNGFKKQASLGANATKKKTKECSDCYATVLSYDESNQGNKVVSNRVVTDYGKSSIMTDAIIDESLLSYAEEVSMVSYQEKEYEELSFPIKNSSKCLKEEKNYGGYDYILASSDTTIKEERKVKSDDSSNIGYNTSETRDNTPTIAIQIGAFRRYSGARSYARKYSLLSSEYRVEIKTGIKDKEPIHRVQIQGFSTRFEATEFKRKYGLVDAFLVRR